MKSARTPAAVDGVLLAALLAAVLAITGLYVSRERFFYYWDHASYQDIAVDTALAFRQSPLAGWRALRQSFDGDYNAVFALPLVPWLQCFGPSRLSYELGIALAYLVPLPLAMGLVATRLVRDHPRLAFWGAAWLALLTPMTWVPTLRGFPDSGAAALVALALFVYLRDLELRGPETRAGLGVLLGLSVLFRRHFAYGVAAFFAAALAHALGTAFLSGRLEGSRARWLGSVAFRLGLVFCLSVAVLFLLGWSYAWRFLAYDTHALYHPYEEPAGAVLRWYLLPYGWLAWFGAAAGLLLGFLSRGVDKSALAFVLLFGATSLGAWCFWARQIGEPYTLHFTTVVVLGLLTLCWTLGHAMPPPSRSALLGTIVGLSLFDLGLGLGAVDVMDKSPLRPLFAATWHPLVRHDYDHVVRLVEYLRERARAGDGVYVAASSHVLNPDIVRHADRILAGGPRGKLEVLAAPALDSAGFYPLGQLLEARSVVVAEPVQHHLSAETQEVVTLAYRAFLEPWEIARDFTESPSRYELQGCTARVYERRRPTTLATALATLATMRAALPERPGLQPDWVVVDRQFRSWLSRNVDGSASFAGHPTLRRSTSWTTLASLDPPREKAEVTGKVRFTDTRCVGATLVLSTLGADGALVTVTEAHLRPREDARFSLRLDARLADRVFLSLLEYRDGASTDHCLLEIDPLVLH